MLSMLPLTFYFFNKLEIVRLCDSFYNVFVKSVAVESSIVVLSSIFFVEYLKIKM